MQLRKTESLGVFDYHNRGVGIVDANFDYGGSKENIDFALFKLFKRFFTSYCSYPAVYYSCPAIAEDICRQFLERLFHRAKLHLV